LTHWSGIKILFFPVGLQRGYTKVRCFLCEWDNRDRKHYYIQKQWPKRESLIPEHKNAVNTPLIDPEKFYLPPLHIKLELIKVASRRGSK
jgi:hypothetical protein